MVQTLSLVGAAFAVGGSYFAVDSLRDILLAKTINTSYATRIAIAGAATLAGLAMISSASATQARKNTKNRLSKQLMSAEEWHTKTGDEGDDCQECGKDLENETGYDWVVSEKMGGMGQLLCSTCHLQAGGNFNAEAYDHRTERAWSGMLSNAPGDAVVNQVDLFHDKHILAHDDAHRAAQSWLRKNEKDQFNEIHYMLYQIDAGKWGMEYLALDTMDAEELTFHDWSNQEMMNHGKDDSFEDWVEHEIDSHGNVSLQEWGDHEQESHTKRYGHSRPRGAFTARDAEGDDEMKVWVVHVFYEGDHGWNQSERFTTNTYMFRDLSDAEGWVRQKVVSDDIKRSVDELEGDGVMLHLPRRVNSENNESEIRIYEDTIRRSPDLRQYDAEGKTRGYSLDRFTKQKRPSGDSFRRKGRRSALRSMMAADSDDDDDDTGLVPDSEPRRGAPDLWFAESNSKKTFPPIFKKATTGKIQEWRIRTEELPDGNWAYTSSHGQLGGSMVEGKGTIIKAGKQGRTVEEQANAEAAAKWKKKKETGYFESADEATNNVVVLPMTALNFKNRAHDINWPAIGQPKLDGVRCLARLEADGTVSLTSRKNKLFPGMDHIREELATRLTSLGNSEGSPFPSNIVVDGELYADPEELTFQQSTGVVRRNNKTPEDLEDEKKIKLNVYDCINLDDPDMDFIDRHNLMADSLSNMDSIAIVDNTTLSDTDAVDPLHDKFVTQGYEGLMIRNVKGPYKLNGKSKHLQKYKSFQDDEFKIVGYTEGKGDYVGTVIWICETSDGKQFRVKPNGTHAYRSKLFDEADSHIGKEITVRFFELTDGGLPRHPTGGWFRDYEAESFDADFEAERGCSYPCPDCGTMMYQHNSNTDFGSYCSCIKCGSKYITKPMNAESSKHWDESSRTMWDQSEVTDPDELVRLGKIFKVGNGNPEGWKKYLDEFGPFVYVTKDTRPWALWQPGSKEAVVRFNNRGKTRDNLHITDIQQLYEIKSDESFGAEVFESFDFGSMAPPMDTQCDLCNKWRGDTEDFNRHIAYDCPATASRRQELIAHYKRLGLGRYDAESAPIANETCRQDHLLCDDCMAVCLECNPDANAGGDVCRFCTGESIERFDADFEAERGCSYPCPDCGTMMYQHNSNTDFGSYCSCIKCGSKYITKPMNAESSKHWDESSRTMWDQSEVTDPDELVRLGKIFKVGNGNPEGWKKYLNEFGPFVYVTKDTRPWALWQPGSKEAVVRFNNRGKIRDNLHITDIQQLYEIKSDESFDAEAPHYHGDCDDCKQPMMLGKEIKNRSGVPTLTSSKMCQGCDEVVCGSCHSQAKVCPHCDESFDAESSDSDILILRDNLNTGYIGYLWQFKNSYGTDDPDEIRRMVKAKDDLERVPSWNRMSIGPKTVAKVDRRKTPLPVDFNWDSQFKDAEVFEAFSTSDRPVSVSFGKGTSGNAKMKAVFTDGSGDTKTTQFGYKGMSDYTKHGDDKRKSSYLARHGAKSSGQKWNDPTTAGSLSRWVLWNKKSLSESKKSFKNKFNLGAEGNYESPIEEEGYQQSIFITEAGRRSVWAYEPDYSITEDSL